MAKPPHQRDIDIHTAQTLRGVAALRARLVRHDADASRALRHAAGECRPCYYLATGRGFAHGITERDCAACGQVVPYAAADTRRYCADCSKTLHVCRSCGGDLEGELRDVNSPLLFSAGTAIIEDGDENEVLQ